MDRTYDEPSLTLLPEVEARQLLAGRTLRFTLLRPPFPALGIGDLRVLRVTVEAAATLLVAGYERYERLPL